MPLYDYKCDECHTEQTEYHKMDEKIETCPCCGSNTFHKMPSKIKLHEDYLHPTMMHSIACNTQQEIDELRRKAPGIEISDDPRDPDWGVPKARNRTQKLAALKATGYEERN